MSKRAKILTALMVTLVLLVSLIFAPISHDRRVAAKVRDLEYWERTVTGQSTPTDWVRRRLWANIIGKQRDPDVEIMNCREDLLAMGFLVRQTFFLSAPVTNSADFASLHKAVMAEPLSDLHWSYSTSTNRIEALIARKDMPAWEALVKSWDSRRRAASVTNHVAEPLNN